MNLVDIPNFDQLSDLERLKLAEELVNSVRLPEALPPPVAHRFELERRWTEFDRNPDMALTPEQFWSAVKTLKA
jgi:putative addiction module component (TIGR02574 family)